VPEFNVVVKEKDGQKRQLRRKATDQAELLEKLHRDGLFVIEMKEAKNGRTHGDGGGLKRLSMNIGNKETTVKLERLVFFTRQLATMVASGLPIVKILRSLASEEKPAFGRTLAQVADDVERGDTFSDALRKHPRVFNRLYTSLVESGEESGKLDTILDQLANYLETMADIRMRVKSALRYPIFVFSFIGFIFLAFILLVIPKFASIYESFNAALPLPTKMVLSFSNLVRQNLLVTILVIAIFLLIIRLLARTERGAFVMDNFKLHLPIVGRIMERTIVSRLARTLGVLSQSGMPIVRALNIVRRAADNKVFETGVLDAKRRVEQGQPLAEALQGTQVFPNLVLQLVSTGEQSGTLDVMFTRVAEFYEKQVKASVDGLVSLIEPIAVVTMGVAVGGIILVMYLPIFRLGMVMR